MKKRFLLYSAVLLTAVITFRCQKEIPNQPKQNQLPTTRLWLQSDQTLLESSSRQHLYWYGEDPDGKVIGYLLTVVPMRLPNLRLPVPDTLTYFWTTKSDSIMPLPLLQARDSFTIVIRAVDNTFNPGSLTEGSPVRMAMYPELQTSADPKGAVQLFPLRNTPPIVYFIGDPASPDSTVPILPPAYTFPAATFSWRATDLDGDNTIAGFRIALNDTSTSSRWLSLSPSTTNITIFVPRSVSDAATGEVDAEVYTGTYPSMQFRGKVPGLRLDNFNRLYLQALDVAGEYSRPVRIPDSLSPLSNRTWFVKKPQSKMLFVLDYGPTTTPEKNAVTPFYRRIFSDNTILNGTLTNFDSLDIAIYKPYFLNPTLIKTLQLFDVVVWATNKFPSIVPAQIGLFNYTQSGGKVIFTTTFATALSYADLHALNDFAPLDSTSSDAVNPGNNPPTNVDSRISVMNGSVKTKVYSMVSGYPDLTVDSVQVTGSATSAHTLNMRKIYKRTDSQYIYRLDSSRSASPRYLGSPTVACIDNNKTFLVFALPLHILNGNPRNLPLFFKHVIEDEFGIH